MKMRQNLAVRITPSQRQHIDEIRSAVLMEESTPIVYALMEFALQFERQYGYGIVCGVVTKVAPAKMAGTSLLKLVRPLNATANHSAEFVDVTMATNELSRVCAGLAAILRAAMPAHLTETIAEDDFRGIVAAWRSFSPFDRADHDATVDLLGRLVASFPNAEEFERRAAFLRLMAIAHTFESAA